MAALEIRAVEPIFVKLSEITLDPGLLLRPLDEETAASYAEALRRKEKLPAIRVMRLPDGSLTCVDGQHRHRAHLLAKRDSIEVTIEDGDRAAALLASAGSNCEHGKSRDPETKARAVLALRAEPFYADKSARWIAEACRVSPSFASKVLATVSENSSEEPRATMGKDGKVRRAPRKPKRKPFDATKQVKLVARTIDQIAKKWPANVPLVALIELLYGRLGDLEKRQPVAAEVA